MDRFDAHSSQIFA